MKPWLKVLIGTLVGFGGGFATGFFFHKRLNDVEFEEIEKEEMEELERKVKEKEEAKKPRELTDNDISTNPDQMRMTLQGKVSYLKADQELKEKYSEAWNSVKRYSDEENADNMPVETIEEGFDEEFLEMIEQEEVEPGQVEPPHAITMSEFYNERKEYDKITIDWYEPDDTFLDEREEVIADIRSYVGNIDVKKIFADAEYGEDPDVRFVRNEQYGSDYEIVRHKRSWFEMMNGGEE